MECLLTSEEYKKLKRSAIRKSRIREIKNLSIDADSRTNTIFERLRDLSKKSRIRETKNLSTDADRRTDTILERLRDLSKK